MTVWQIDEAKDSLSELIDCVLSEESQVITRRCVEVGVVMPILRYKKLTASKQRPGDFLLSSPLHKSGIVIERERKVL
jgi:prevent-host-death family protein